MQLLSAGQITDLGCRVILDSDSCCVQDAETQTHYEDKEAESVYLTYSPDNLETRLLRQTLKDHDEVKKIDATYKDVLNDDATEQKTQWRMQHKRRRRWRRQDWQGQRKEDEASQAPRDAVSLGGKGQYQPESPCIDPEQNKNQNRE